MALDTSGNWEVGDDLRVIDALEMSFSEYTLSGLQSCMGQLESISPSAVLRVRDELTRYETAKEAKKEADLARTGDTVLVQADVLKYQYIGENTSGVMQEMLIARTNISRYFDFCPYTPNSEDITQGGSTSLIRS